VASSALQRKLRFGGLASIAIFAAPRGLAALVSEIVGDGRRTGSGGDGAIAFARSSADLERAFAQLAPFVADDMPAWLAYPKRTGAIESDLDRDQLMARGTERSMRAVAQVALDDTWSAIRLLPA